MQQQIFYQCNYVEMKILCQHRIPVSHESCILEREYVLLFKDVKYVDAIRMVYDGLLCIDVSTRNIEGVIRSVLKNVGINLGQLPR